MSQWQHEIGAGRGRPALIRGRQSDWREKLCMCVCMCVCVCVRVCVHTYEHVATIMALYCPISCRMVGSV